MAPAPAAHAAELVGSNRSLCAAIDYARKAARRECPVLIVGETGTGKDQIARLIHAHSDRASGPFVSLNCGALPESLIESELFGFERGAFTGAGRTHRGHFLAAHNGTLFLDELGDLPLSSQAKLLRAIESREVTPLGSTTPRKVDLRIIAATHQPLEQMVRERRFRQDLYYRLNVARVCLPPLRERRDDLLELAAHFMAPLRRSAGGTRVGWFDSAALKALMRHDWPGNVRELRNVIESIFVDPPEGAITERHLPAYLQSDTAGQGSAMELLAGDERRQILETLTATHWNKAAAARNLNWSRVTLYRKLAKYEIGRGAAFDTSLVGREQQG